MQIYLVLVAAIAALMFAEEIGGTFRGRNMPFKLGILLVFSVLALKKSTVGIDMPGYERNYYVCSEVPWDDFDWAYFEPGYMLLMKISSKLFGLDFHSFCVIAYLFITLSLYFFLKKYSERPCLSLLVYVCYTFFAFNVSGLRNSIAIGIVLIGLTLLRNESKKSVIAFVACVVLAAQVHTSAWIALLYVPLSKFKFTKPHVAALLMVGLLTIVLRSALYSLLASTIRDFGAAPTMSPGGNVLALIVLLIFSGISIFIIQNRKRFGMRGRPADGASLISEAQLECLALAFACVFLGVILLLISAESVLSRAAMYLLIFSLILLPNVVVHYDAGTRFAILICVAVLLFAFFYNTSLIKNSLDLVPYSYFWD